MAIVVSVLFMCVFFIAVSGASLVVQDKQKAWEKRTLGK